MEKGSPAANSSNGSNGLGAWLKEKCQKERLSLRQVAVKAGLSHATISDIKNGGRPSAATIVKLAEAFADNGQQQAELKDLLLRLSGYRSERNKEETSVNISRVIEKISQLDPAQLELIEHLAGFVSGAGTRNMKGARSSTGVLVLPKLRLNFYLSFDDEEPELSHFSRLPDDMQETIIGLAKKYEKEVGQAPET